MSDQPVFTTPRPRGRVGRVVEGTSCACSPNGMCLSCYDGLDAGRQAAARRRAGVSEQYLGPRR